MGGNKNIELPHRMKHSRERRASLPDAYPGQINWNYDRAEGTRWNNDQPEHVEYTAQEIEALVEEFKRLEIELFKLRRRIETRHAE